MPPEPRFASRLGSGYVDAGVESYGDDLACRVALDNAHPQRLRNVQGVFDLEDVRSARLGDRQEIPLPLLWPQFDQLAARVIASLRFVDAYGILTHAGKVLH